jgi:hypothetical protein
VRACFPVFALILSGCSAGGLGQTWSGPPVDDLSQPNYRRVVGDNIKRMFPREDALGGLEISEVRPVDHLKGPTWLTCLRRTVEGHPQYFAIFIQGDKVVDFRVAVVIDQCHKEAYTPFEIATAATKPGM